MKSPDKLTQIPQEQKYAKLDVKYKGVRSETYLGQQIVYYGFELYHIEQKDGKTISKDPFDIERRYSHFEWLQKELEREFYGRIIPEIPEKTINYDVDKRKYQFVYFIQKIIKHPHFMESKSAKMFLLERQLITFQQFVDQSVTTRESGTILANVIGAGANILNYAQGWFKKAPLQLTMRVNDEKDKEFENVNIRLNLDKNAFINIYRDIEIIANKFELQYQSLQSTETIFLTDCQSNSNYFKLQSMISNYKNLANKLKERFLYKIESYLKDFDRVQQVLVAIKQLKDQIHKDSQIIISQPDQRQKLAQDIKTNTDRVATLQANFIEDLPIFHDNSKNQLNDILKNVNNELQQFKIDVRSYKSMS